MLIKKLQAHGIMCDTIPLIKILYNKDAIQEKEISQLFNEKIIAVFTSKHAVEAVRNIQGIQNARWRIYCTGQSTARLASEALPGSTLLGTADNAASLAHLIVKNESGSKIDFFCGDIRRDELPSITGQLIKIREWIVYRTALTPMKIEEEYEGIIFLSPSAVKSFFSLNKPSQATLLFAIGNTTAAEIKLFCENRILTGNKTTTESLVDKLIAEIQPVKGMLTDNNEYDKK
jgi:uroporphyrinogen-III synthase